MKRFLCTILAIAMVISMIPAVFAEGETEVTSRTYTFSATATGANAGGSVSNVNSFDYNGKQNGWQYININQEAKDLNNVRVNWLQSNDLEIYAAHTNSGYSLTGGVQLALAIEKPSTESGFYKATVTTSNCDTKADIQFYMGKWDKAKNPVKTYMTDAAKFNTATYIRKNTSHALDGILYNDGTSDFAFVINTLGPNLVFLQSLTLDKISPDISLALDKTVINLNDTATASVNATWTESGVATTQKVLNDYVTYESDDESVAKISKDAEGNVIITAEEKGTATITATVGNESKTQTIKVVDLSGVKVEYGTYFTTNTINGVSYYGPHAFTYALKNGTLSYHEAVCTEEGGSAYYWDQTAKTSNTGLSDGTYRFIAAHDLKPGSDDYAAYKIRIPAAGDYMASLVYLARRNVQQIQDESGNPVEEVASPVLAATSADMYILPITAASDITAALTTATPVISNVNFYSTTNQFKTTEEVVFSAPSAGEYLMVWKNTGSEGKRITPVKLTLNGGTGIAPIWANVSVENSELEVNGTTALTSTVYTSDGKAAIDTTRITYESTNGAVATVADGTVTAVGAGAAKIQAKSGDYVLGEVDVTVTLPKAPTVSFYAESNVDECPIEITAKDVDNNAVEAAKAATLTRGADVTVNAPTYEGYTFRGWMRGTADGQVVSLEKEYSFRAMTHTMLTAVYTEDDSKDEWYNFNGEFLGTSEPTEDPTLLGYKFLKTWREEVIDGITRHIAQFEKTTDTYNIAFAEGITEKSKDEEANYYDTQVVLEAQDEVFWLRGGKVVDFGKTYTFNIWDATNITTAATGYDKSLPMVYLDSAKGTSRMIEYDKGAYEIVEVGILFGEAGDKLTVDSSYEKATSQWKKAHGQFTAKPTKDSYTNARGYLIYEDGNEYKVIYAD